MTPLQHTVDDVVARGVVPGAVALIAEGGAVTAAVAGVRVAVGDAGGGELAGAAAAGRVWPMTRDALFAIASLTKPITAAAAMVLVERGVVGLEDPVSRWLPELADPVVLRRPDGPLDDVVPAVRPITVRHLLTSTNGLGFPSDLSWPIAARLLGPLHQGPPDATAPPAEEWLARVAGTPLVHQPGEGWTYNTASDILGVLLARAGGGTLGDVLEEAILGPVGMADTGFAVPAGDVGRMAAVHVRDEETGVLAVEASPAERWITPPPFESGAAGLVSSADDWLAFGRMLLAGGRHEGRQVLSARSVRLMMTSHAQAEPGNPFLQGQGWGFGGGVDLAVVEPWHVPGRYGWVGGTGTAGYVIPSLDRVVVWMGAVQLAGPDDASGMGEVLALAAGRAGVG